MNRLLLVRGFLPRTAGLRESTEPDELKRRNTGGCIMTDIAPLIPRQPVPALAAPLVGGGRFDIEKETPQHFSFVVFYRGLHCPICRTQMGDLETKLPEFRK